MTTTWTYLPSGLMLEVYRTPECLCCSAAFNVTLIKDSFTWAAQRRSNFEPVAQFPGLLKNGIYTPKHVGSLPRPQAQAYWGLARTLHLVRLQPESFTQPVFGVHFSARPPSLYLFLPPSPFFLLFVPPHPPPPGCSPPLPPPCL